MFKHYTLSANILEANNNIIIIDLFNILEASGYHATQMLGANSYLYNTNNFNFRTNFDCSTATGMLSLANVLRLHLDLYTINSVLSSFGFSMLCSIHTLISDTQLFTLDNLSAEQSCFLITIYICVSYECE